MGTTLVADVEIGTATSVANGKFTIAAGDIKNLAEVNVTAANVTGVTINVDSTAGALAKIMNLTYEENGKKCTYAVDASGNTTFTTVAA